MAAPATPQGRTPTSSQSPTILVRPAATVSHSPSLGRSAATRKLWNMFCKMKGTRARMRMRPYKTAWASISPSAPRRTQRGSMMSSAASIRTKPAMRPVQMMREK